MKQAFILGSINLDLVMYTDRMPFIGESKLGHDMFSNLGGKGANQAIAIKKLGVEQVYLLGAIGKDNASNILLKEIKKTGLDTSGIERIEGKSSGTCFIIFDESQNDNLILVDKGANSLNDPLKAKRFLKDFGHEKDIFVTQLETNLDAVYEAIKTAKEVGMYVILNPAPVCEFDKNILPYVDLLVVNETEAQLLSGIEFKQSTDIFLVLQKLKSKSILITLGKNGAYYSDGASFHFAPARKVKTVDTTCAGDTFIGALAYRKANGYSIEESLSFASICSSITVSRKGAAQSIPEIKEVLQIIQEEKNNEK